MGISSLRELRLRFLDATFSETFTNAASTTWNTDNSHKIRTVSIDDSGLSQEGIEDETLETRMYRKRANHPGLRKGTLKFDMYVDGAPSGTGQGVVGGLFEVAMGAVVNPTNARSSTVNGTSTTTNIQLVSADTYCEPGQAVLIGAKGDGKGGGEVKIVTAVSALGASYYPACAGIPVTGDTVVFSSTAFLDEDAAQNYVDSLLIGDDSADQRQTVGGATTFSLEGLAAGELPKASFEITAADHQYVEASGDRAAFNHDAAAAGSNPAHDRAIGLTHLGDAQATARTSRKVAGITITPNLVVLEHPEPGGVNGIGAYERAPGVPEIEMSLLHDQDMPGLAQDYNTGTAKSCILQYGHAATKTFAVDFPNCYVADLPTRDDEDGLTVSKIKLRANEDYSAGNTDLNRSAMRIHRF